MSNMFANAKLTGTVNIYNGPVPPAPPPPKSKKRKLELECEHCHKSGHVQEECWQKYPEKRSKRAKTRERKKAAKQQKNDQQKGDQQNEHEQSLALMQKLALEQGENPPEESKPEGQSNEAMQE